MRSFVTGVAGFIGSHLTRDVLGTQSDVRVTNFDEALDVTIDWYCANDWWWRPLKERGACRRQGLVRRA